MEGTRIVLVRHGESRAQELGILGGHDGCQGLSDLGREQVGELRDRLAATGELADASALYSSMMPRAIETAEILAPALGGLEVRSRVRLLRGPPRRGRRAHLGRARRALPGGARAGTPTPSGRRAGRRGSRWASASPRALESLVERHPARPSSSRATAAWWCTRCSTTSASTSSGRRRRGRGSRRDNTSLTEFRFAPNPYVKRTLPVQLVRYNDHAHLGALERQPHSI